MWVFQITKKRRGRGVKTSDMQLVLVRTDEQKRKWDFWKKKFSRNKEILQKNLLRQEESFSKKLTSAGGKFFKKIDFGRRANFFLEKFTSAGWNHLETLSSARGDFFRKINFNGEKIFRKNNFNRIEIFRKIYFSMRCMRKFSASMRKISATSFDCRCHANNLLFQSMHRYNNFVK